MIKRPRRLTGAFVALVLTTALLAACGSDDDDDTATTSAGSTADGEEEGEYEIVSDAAVAKGYADMLTAMTTLAGDPSTASEEALEEVHELWESFEGTVKQNDADAYLASEEALDSFLEAGADADGPTMLAATTKMANTSQAYLAAHPG